MQYLLTVLSDEQQWASMADADQKQNISDNGKFAKSLVEAGVLVHGAGLGPSSTVTTVRKQDEQVLVTDGTYTETTEWLGGFYLLECPDLDAALAWARKAPLLSFEAIQVHPVADH
ncbi:YciI family protein [Allokutzneria sp. A3M-2-11 16]|uniref:YciI family protein n=1 Tax=Allokutzneria sp. A3M-2-11 16 TaxID=2962043 RepID=UPI0020B6D89E|nr:YciI family protein [Allokutzneria sp. A3M-2-11 16]MCP3801068.1 YciI family protein [Allokutzneria sp. A3M-2-11 16]